jgi:hypothetical protein
VDGLSFSEPIAMTVKKEFGHLDPLTQSYALVGKFLNLWALVEARIDSLLEVALELTPLQRVIVCNNVPFLNKIHILKTTGDIGALKPSEKEKISRLLEKVRKFYIKNRNTVAHHLFAPAKTGIGVEFLITKAKGKIEFPNAEWSDKDFDNKFEKMNGFINDLPNLEKKFKRSHSFLTLGAALMKNPPPMQGTSPLASLGLLGTPLPEDHKSDTTPSNQQTDAETPPSDQA